MKFSALPEAQDADRRARARSVAARTALVLETNNLRGGAGLDQIVGSLKRLVAVLSCQAAPLAQWIVTHDGLPAAARAEIVAAAGRDIDFIEIRRDTGYYEAKNAGFEGVDAARCDFVVFGDADCRPCEHWIECLLAPFARDAADAPDVVAGRTSYAPDVLGVALTSIDFMYFPSPLRQGATRNFYANNVAFRRGTFAQYRYQPLRGVYRAHCQVMGLRLQAAGVVVEYAPDAHTEHRFPDTYGETFKLRWMRGEDSVTLTRYLVETYLPRGWQWLGHSGPIGPFCVMMSRLGYSLRALNEQQLPRLGGVRYLAALGVMLAVSAVDTLGALARGAGMSSGRRDLEALSYHRP